MGTSKTIGAAVEDVLLGVSLRSLYLDYQMRVLGIEDEDDWADALRQLGRAERERLSREANDFVADVCRRLGERHAGDHRIGRVLQDWVADNKDYAAFDALLSYFDFPSRSRVLAEARRLFPGTLTSHWQD
ncbi:MAG: hypothetical protein H6832_13030 [Planctomycetes bacterium]|nr:hypothetical protein [Planctomycetota bacterium]